MELSHSEALLDLTLRAGEELDPEIVNAAEQVVAEEQGFVRSPGFQPRLHRVPLPRPVRRAKLPTVLAHLTERARKPARRAARRALAQPRSGSPWSGVDAWAWSLRGMRPARRAA